MRVPAPSMADQSQNGYKAAIALSVVVPVFNEVQSLRVLHQQLTAALNALEQSYEIIFVDDGSNDGSYEVLEELHRKDPAVRVIRFRRNFGKTPALVAGFERSRGAIVMTMDADLQDDPAEIPQFLAKLNEGYDLVCGWKYPRLDPPSKTLPSRLFNKTVSLTTGVQLHDMNCGFKAYSRDLVDDLKLYGELHRFVPVLAHQRGFRVAEIKVRHHPRRFGVSKFGARRFARGFMDLLMVLFITTYLRTPLRLFGTLGLLAIAVGTLMDLYYVILRIVNNDPIHQHPIVYFGILLIVSGLSMFLTGLQSEMTRHFAYHPGDEYSIKRVLE
jgi:glycosyltransferase involved in cell wall biosynthesis